MAIIAKASGGGEFTLCPEGAHASTCVDVIDLGMVETEFNGEKKKQHKVRIVWQTGEINPDNGKPFLAGKRYTNSLHEKATLRKDLESWRGRAFTKQELTGFDLENLLSAPALLNVIHEARSGKTYDNVTTIMRLPRGMAAPEATDYVRKCDRTPEAPTNIDVETYAPNDDDVPF